MTSAVTTISATTQWGHCLHTNAVTPQFRSNLESRWWHTLDVASTSCARETRRRVNTDAEKIGGEGFRDCFPIVIKPACDTLISSLLSVDTAAADNLTYRQGSIWFRAHHSGRTFNQYCGWTIEDPDTKEVLDSSLNHLGANPPVSCVKGTAMTADQMSEAMRIAKQRDRGTQTETMDDGDERLHM